jgi:hypothetical protein
MWALGEFDVLPWELRNRRVPCGCGQPQEDCDFWGPILADLPTTTDGYHIGYFRDMKHTRKILRWNHLPDLIRGSIGKRWEKEMQEYGRNNVRYFFRAHQRAEERTGNRIDWLIDASKDPYRLFWLKQSERFNLRVIHLVKDPRAFVDSATRRYDLTNPRAFRWVLHYIGRWIIENGIMAHLARTKFPDAHTVSLAYEQLATQPEETLNRLGGWLGIEYASDTTRTFLDYENHGVSGGYIRWADRDTRIRLDERWKRRLPTVYKRFISLLSRPFLDLAGYPASSI